MSSIKLEGNASGTGIFTIASPNSNTNRTLTLPDNTGTFITTGSSGQSIPRAALPTGSVLQVVSTTKTDTFSTSSTSFTDVTGLTVNITPSNTNNKVFVLCSFGAIDTTGNLLVPIRILRDSTAIGIGDAAGSRVRSGIMLATAGDNRSQSASWSFLDSPSTTSSTTYKVQAQINFGTLYFNRTSTDTDDNRYGRTVCTITVMEIAA